METVNHRKLIFNAFNKLHEQLSIVRCHVETLGDAEAQELLESMEFGLLAPMRRLRVHLDIPYDWREPRSAAQEVAS